MFHAIYGAAASATANPRMTPEQVEAAATAVTQTYALRGDGKETAAAQRDVLRAFVPANIISVPKKEWGFLGIGSE